MQILKWCKYYRIFIDWVNSTKFIIVRLYMTIYSKWKSYGLDTLNEKWNYQKVIYSKGCQDSGFPSQLCHLLQYKGYISQGYHVTKSIVKCFSATEL